MTKLGQVVHGGESCDICISTKVPMVWGEYMKQKTFLEMGAGVRFRKAELYLGQ